jgi:hypothetical protein
LITRVLVGRVPLLSFASACAPRAWPTAAKQMLGDRDQVQCGTHNLLDDGCATARSRRRCHRPLLNR